MSATFLIDLFVRAEHVQNAFQKCPNTKVVMSGYSQGAMLVHNAAKQLPANISGKVSVVVNFGDPCKYFSTSQSKKNKLITSCS